jgi:hypothetical protein
MPGDLHELEDAHPWAEHLAGVVELVRECVTGGRCGMCVARNGLSTARRHGRGTGRRLVSWGFGVGGAGEGNRTLMTSLEGCGPQPPELLRPRSGHVFRDREFP